MKLENINRMWTGSVSGIYVSSSYTMCGVLVFSPWNDYHIPFDVLRRPLIKNKNRKPTKYMKDILSVEIKKVMHDCFQITKISNLILLSRIHFFSTEVLISFELLFMRKYGTAYENKLPTHLVTRYEDCYRF